MANKVIGDYDAAVSIDGSTHYLLIQPGDASTAYDKISRDVLLGVTGQPADISSSQNLTNKTLDNTNIATLRDDRFTLQDSADTTKQAVFQLSGISAATTRTYTLPNASSTLADIATAQTFTNKTLTSPTITGGSITGSTITVNAIVGQSAATTGTIYGLQVTSAEINGTDIQNGTVGTSQLGDSSATPAKLLAGTGSSWVWQSWTTTLNNITLGSGTKVGTFIQTGKTVDFKLKIVLSSSTMGTEPQFTVPVAMNAAYSTSRDTIPNSVVLWDSSASSRQVGALIWIDANTLAIRYVSGAQVYTQISSTGPFTWANGDELIINGSYEAA